MDYSYSAGPSSTAAAYGTFEDEPPLLEGDSRLSVVHTAIGLGPMCSVRAQTCADVINDWFLLLEYELPLARVNLSCELQVQPRKDVHLVCGCSSTCLAYSAKPHTAINQCMHIFISARTVIHE